MDWFPEPYEDETLYSVLARLWNCMGRPNIAAYSRALSGGRHWVALTPLPCQLDALGRHFGWDDAAIDRVIDNHTMLPFYTAYAGPTVRARARAALRQSANGLHLLLGIATSPVPAPRYLRFCPTCLDEMLRDNGEGWWRRIHQLPGIDICPIHGTALSNSPVEISQSGRHEFMTADKAMNGLKSSDIPLPQLAGCGKQGFAKLARAAADLLLEPAPARIPIELYDHLIKSLRQAGLLRGTRHVLHEPLRAMLVAYWGDALDRVSALSLDRSDGTDWLVDHVRNRCKLAHPLRHLVLEMALAQLESVEQPFGEGPWPCLNPVGGHFLALTIGKFKQVRDKGKLHAHFVCDCDYSYSKTRHLDGRVGATRFRSFRAHVGRARAPRDPVRYIAARSCARGWHRPQDSYAGG